MKSRGGGTLSVFDTSLKPIIGEIARTEVCFPSIKLLVEKISLENISKTDTFSGAFRLWLSDGERCIQALVRRRLYKMIVSGDIREGTYILVKEYVLARADRVNGEGEVLYFVLKDFYAIGEDDREKPEIPDFFQVIDEAMGAEQSKVPSPIDDVAHEPIFPITYSNTSPRPRRRLVDERPSSCSSGLPAKTDLKKLSNVEPFSALNEDMPTEPSCSVSSQDRARKRKREIALGEIDPNLSSPPKKIAKTNDEPGKKVSSHNPEEIPAQERVSPGPNSHPNITKEPSDRKRPNAVSTAAPLFTRPVITARKVNQTRVMSAINPVVRIPSNRLVPIERVLSIIPLAKLRGYTRRNDVYDVFVVVYSVGSEVIKRSRMPAKRDLRVIDPSTEKKVLLSIFVDPDKFKPAVGTIALIRSVTTHEWDGGMINVYPKQCEGKQWFLPDPVGIPGCDVAHLRAWWTKKQAEEAKRIHEEKTQE